MAENKNEVELPPHIRVLVSKLAILSDLSESKIMEVLILVGIDTINKDVGLYRYFTNINKTDTGAK